tara:strand:- start:853 stop:1908 length:1056 start_codon:yes stop_codon:yes gene_type:complete
LKKIEMNKENMLLSILVPSKNKNNLNEFLNSFENNSSNPKNFEVIINVNYNDKIMIDFVKDQIKKRSFIIKYIESPPGYFNGHVHNNMAQRLTNKKSYFISCLTDRMLIKTKNWDKILEKYVNFYKDDIFRITCSANNNRNYIDYWESCFAPCNIVFTTRKWIEICGNKWSPVFSADAFQQSISYYMMIYDNFSSFHFKRDISLYDLDFDGQYPEAKSEIDEYERFHGQLKAWDILVSPITQKNAKKNAMLLILNILQRKHNGISCISNSSNYTLYKDNKIFLKLNFNVNNFKYYITNFYRKFYYLNYCGSGFNLNSYTRIFNIAWFLDHRFKFFRGIKDFTNRYLKNKKY